MELCKFQMKKANLIYIDNQVECLKLFEMWAGDNIIHTTNQTDQVLNWISIAGPKFDIIIIGDELPKISGLDFAKKISNLVKCPIVLLSSSEYIDHNTVKQFVNYIFFKPIIRCDFDEIISLCNSKNLSGRSNNNRKIL